MQLFTRIPNKVIVITEEQHRDLLIEAMLLKDIKQKYYADIPDDVFSQIIQSDPTFNPEKPDKIGRYGKWLLTLYKTGRLKTEDLYKAKDYLATFVKYYNVIQDKDINHYKSLPELYNVVKQYTQGDDIATSKSDEIRKMKNSEAEKVYEDDRWLIVIPHTEAASCYYGKGTQWCTAADESNNMFDDYNSRGPLYINIDKKNNTKYQFHFETDSFMDAEDCEILSDNQTQKNLAGIIGLTDGAVKYYNEVAKKPVAFEDSDRNAAIEECDPLDLDSYYFASDEYGEEEGDIEEYMEEWQRNVQDYLEETYDADADVTVLDRNCVIVRIFDKQSIFDVELNNLANGQWFDSISWPKCGWFAVKNNNQMNYYDNKNNRFLFDWGQFDSVSDFTQNQGIATVSKNGKQTLINTKGEQIIKEWYEYISNTPMTDGFRHETQWHKVKENGKFNMRTIEGDWLLDTWADSLGFFGNNRGGLAYVKVGNEEFYIDKNKKRYSMYGAQPLN